MREDQGNKIWVTGATGFIGRALVDTLVKQGRQVVQISRLPANRSPIETHEWLAVGNLAEFHDSALLEDVDCILHLAGLTQLPRGDKQDPGAAFMLANRDSTSALACAAAKAGVRRFVLVSSIGVLGNSSEEHPFDEQSPVAPYNAYTYSKRAAELALWDVTKRSALEGVVLRTPLVYGPNSKGNLSLLVRALRLGLPLPLGAIHNRRSLIGLDNLVNLLIYCIEVPEAAGEHFLVSDQEVVSTTELLRGLAKAIGNPARLLPLPPQLVALTAKLLGRKNMAEQLLGNLEINSSKLRNRLNWHPPFTFEEGLATLAQSETDKE